MANSAEGHPSANSIKQKTRLQLVSLRKHVHSKVTNVCGIPLDDKICEVDKNQLTEKEIYGSQVMFSEQREDVQKEWGGVPCDANGCVNEECDPQTLSE